MPRVIRSGGVRLFGPAVLLAALVVAGGLFAGGSGGGGNGGGALYPPHVPGEILIKLRPGIGPAERASLRGQVQAQLRRTFRSGAEHWVLGPGWQVEQAIAALRNSPRVAYVEPNYLVNAELVPNDPDYSDLYGLHNTGQTGGTPGADIDAERAWNVSTGSAAVVVAVIDTGVDYNHPDLADNIWTNPGEIPGNGIDDEGNGFIDDLVGWDFINDDNNPFDDNGHGTHVSGTIGAVGDNLVGVVGVNWDVSIMGVKFLSAGGSGSTDDAIASIDYATMMGVDVMSNSWGGGGFSQAMLDAINGAAAAEAVFVAAAGNSNTDNDVSPHYPSNYNAPNVIAVAATDHNDVYASFSNYGATSVDLAAPGVEILSTMPGDTYGTLSGTSMATPHVSGVAALMRAVAPGIPAAQLKAVLLNFAEPVPSLAGITVTGGRLNAFFPIAEPDDVPPGMVDDLAFDEATSNSIFLTWTATGDDGETGTASDYDVRYSTMPIDESNFDAASQASGAPVPGPSGSPQAMEVTGLDPDTTYYFALRAGDEWGNEGPVSNLASGMTLPPPVFASTPDSFTAALLTGQSTTETLMITNAGPGTLDWSIPLPAVSGPMVEQQPFLDLAKGEPDPRSGAPVALGFGGPDMFGYRWIDSDEPGGPAFVWDDISATGTPIAELTGDDQTSSPIPLGFTVSFYGNAFDSVRVSTNGWISFTSSATSYSNQPLPNSGAPENLIAPLWDDLHFRGAARATYASDGSRFLVQYTDVDRYATGSNLTFQVEVAASGEILYRYLSMAGVLDSATVGIQNATKDDGLTVVFNAPYVHDALAVRIAAIPQWLTAGPTSGRLYSGESQAVTVGIDATGLDGGTYQGDVLVRSNDPSNPAASHPVTLQVTGAPAIGVSTDVLDFGLVFTGFTRTLPLQVNNTGTDELTVDRIVSGDAAVTVSPSSFTVPAHGSQSVDVTFAPVAPMTLASMLTIESDASNLPILTVDLLGESTPPPVVLVDPTSFSEQLYTGGSVSRNLRINNTGGSDLVVTLSTDLGSQQAADLFVALPKGDESDAGSGELQGQGMGGPDGFGYRWKDSDETGGPPFSWVDISGTGTPITFPSSDDSLSPVISMGMTFPFYGNDFSSIKVSTNGWLTFNTAYTGSSLAGNASLPSTSLPQNSIALMWDDLHLRTGRVYYQFDGSRFILQYNNVGRFTPSTGQSYTFQAQLYPGGKIVFQYLTMTGTLNSCTIGIQNSTRTIATQIVFNAAYLHNNLAVEISRIPDWLTVTPNSGTIPPDGFQDFTVGFNAGDSGDRLFAGFVNIATNVPDPALVRVPASLQVFGVADVATDPAAVDYGTRFVGYPHLSTLAVQNVGTADLTVTAVTSDDPNLLVEEPPASEAVFVVPPGGSVLYNLRWVPPAPGPLDALVSVASDDPDEPVVTVPVAGNAILAPILGYDPASFTGSLYVGEQDPRMLMLTNTGGSDLEWQIGVRLTNALVVPFDSKETPKGEESGADGYPSMLGSGGPDMFGYRWKDSDAPGGPAFGWVDISGVGTPVSFPSSDDSTAGPIDMGMNFPFYGDAFADIFLSTNGWASFTAPTSSDLSNDPLPSTGGPPNLLAAFWDDLHLRSGAVYTYNDGTRFIVQYHNIGRFSPSTGQSYTFQILLYPTGRIVYQYLTMTPGTLNSATIGIQNEARDDGLNVVFNAAYMHDELAIQFQSIPEWVSVSPASGTIPAGGSAMVDVLLSAVDLIGGVYQGGLSLMTNDPANALVNIPATLIVTGFPGIDASPEALDFGTVYVGVTSSLDLTISNPGSDVLDVMAVQVTGDYSTDTAPFSLVPGASRTLEVTFAPTTDGTRAGSVAFESNATGMPMLTVPLTGDGLFPPVAGLDVGSLEVALPPNGDGERTLRLSNTGASDLEWNASVNLLSILGNPVTPYPALDLGKEDPDPRLGLLGSGGPDMFGYRWNDSDETGGPVFGWIDISGVGAPVTFPSADDSTAGPIDMGMSFPFYGNTFSGIWLSTNGWASFTAPTSSDLSNDPLPSSGGPPNLLAAFWDDLHLRSGAVYTYNDGSRFIVQYHDIGRFSPSTGQSYTFQIVLYPDGHIIYQYLSMTPGNLASATIGIQNATRDDGLQVVFNAAYMHDELAIEFFRIPDWLVVDPTYGVIPAGGYQDLTISVNALGLEDGDHEATIAITSNDPFNGLIEVPVMLHVGEVDLDYLDVDPNTLNLSSNGNTVRAAIQLPAPYDPQEIVISTVSIYGTLFANPSPTSYADDNGDGVYELIVKFDRAAFEALVPEGAEVPVTVTGEVRDTTWFTGTDTIRAIRPNLNAPNGGEYLTAGESVTVSWAAPLLDEGIGYDVFLSRDGGASWEPIGSTVGSTSLQWTVGGPATDGARVRVYASDPQGVMGYDGSDAPFTIAAALYPPNPVGEIDVTADATDVIFRWKRPELDLDHGPASWYRVYIASSPRGPFDEIAEVYEETFRDPHANHEGATILYFKVVAGNAGGASAN